jgi:hypothetical protein
MSGIGGMSWKALARRLAFLLGISCGTFSFEAFAQSDRPASPSGRVTIHQVNVAFIASAAAGGGTLSYKGRAYHFKVGGLGVGGFGASRIDASGSVFNLRQLADFDGVYVQLRSGWAVGDQGKGQMWLRNAHGVILRLKAQREGMALSLGADGMLIHL